MCIYALNKVRFKIVKLDPMMFQNILSIITTKTGDLLNMNNVRAFAGNMFI